MKFSSVQESEIACVPLRALGGEAEARTGCTTSNMVYHAKRRHLAPIPESIPYTDVLDVGVGRAPELYTLQRCTPLRKLPVPT